MSGEGGPPRGSTSPMSTEVLDREIQATTSGIDPLATISAGVDELTTSMQAGFDETQSVMERNLGELSLVRGELSAAHAKDVEMRTRGTLFIC